MARKTYSRRRGGRVDAGAAWISYSDMMAALLLVFVLVLTYSVYQYFVMLQTKTAELEEKVTLLTSQDLQLTDQQTQLSAQKATLDAQQTTLNAQQAALEAKQDELAAALAAIQEQQRKLTEQEGTISAAQAALTEKETALASAQAALQDQQVKLDSATALVQDQQALLSNQQRKLDDLVGVRTKIIRDLSSALASANLKASVDSNTGDIMLDSNVFFDVGKFDIKDSGKKLLSEFIPLYGDTPFNNWLITGIRT